MRTLLCYGDSNTHGSLPRLPNEGRMRLGPQERWPGIVAAELGPEWRVVEEGLPGRTTVHADPVEGEHLNGLLGLPIVLNSHRPVDLVAIMLGTNDAKARFGLTAADIAASVERLLNLIDHSECGPRENAPEALLIAPPPIRETGHLAPIFVGGAARSERCGELYGDVAKRRGVAFLDAGQVIEPSPIDGVHFEAGAHAQLGRAVAEVIENLRHQGA